MSKKSSKHNKKQKNNNKGYKKIAFVVILIFIIIIDVRGKKENIKNEKTQIILNNENITSELNKEIIKKDDNIYMSYEDIQKFIDDTIYQEKDTGLIITTGEKKLAVLEEGNENIKINGSNQKVKDAIIEQDGEKYIAISELENVYDYNFTYIEISNIATIDSMSKKSIKAYAKKNIKIKEEKNIVSKTIDKVKKGNWLIFINEEDGIAKVRTQTGKIGYVKKKQLDNFVTERENLEENNDNNTQQSNILEYDITKKDISTFEKRQNIINLILQEAIKNGKMYVKIIYNGTESEEYQRFKIESVPMLKECGIKIEI